MNEKRISPARMGHSSTMFAQRESGVSEKVNKNEQYFGNKGDRTHPKQRPVLQGGGLCGLCKKRMFRS